MAYDAFISFKNNDATGQRTADSRIAEALYAQFKDAGINAFFSNVTLFEFGETAYKDAIEHAIIDARVMVVIGTSLEHLTSTWVKYEWSSFHEEILSGDKPGGTIVPYLSQSITRAERPMALRNFESFAIEATPVDQVVAFVLSALGRKTEAKAAVRRDPSERDSTYDPSAHRELRRLRTQAENTRPADMPAIDFALSQIPEKTVYVLDAGCAYGYVTFDRFGGMANREIHLLGIDRSAACIEKATANNREPYFSFDAADMEAPDFEERMEALMQDAGIPAFDIIFSSLVIHHLKDPVSALRRLRKFLRRGGFIILRGSDDGSVLAYGDDGLVQKIIDKHLSTPGISDRHNGRKLYRQLYSSGYKQIRAFPYVKDLTGKSFDERMDIFDERFAYRINYVQNLLAKDPDSLTLVNEVRWMEYALKKLEDLFGDESFWYQEVDFVYVAQKA